MKIAAGSLELAHARIWARWGVRPDEAVWRRIEVTRELAGVLDLARNGPLAHWVGEIAPGSGLHAIELALRRQWRARVSELSGWMPAAWQPAIEWCGTWVDLALLQHLARGGTAPAWIEDDEVWRALLAAPAPVPGHATSHDGLAAGHGDPDRLGDAWLAQWRARWPHEAACGELERQFVPLLIRHAAAFGAPQAVDGWGLRRTLQARLVMLLRRALVEPLAAFAFLALTALEGERLRAELVARAAFPHRQPAR
jgi:hypothetical protein